MPVAGDIVRYDAREWVVVDVTGDGIAVLRDDDDYDLEHPMAVMAAVPEVVGHLSTAWGNENGWVEDSPGIWKQT